MDNCLIATDTLHEQWFSLLKKNPKHFILSFFWLFKGLAFFKSKIAEKTDFNSATLPYRQPVLEFLKKKKSEGNSVLVLASASPQKWVQAVADHVGIFDNVLSSSDGVNLKGARKMTEVHQLIRDNNFSYIGDHFVDLHLWKECDEIIAVNPSNKLEKRLTEYQKPLTILRDKQGSLLKNLAKQLRPHQWVKNFLVFLPALAAHSLLESNSLINGLLAFMGFCLTASFIYIFNDLLDLPADRNHHTKKNRPLASGRLPVIAGVSLLPFLSLGTITIAVFLPFLYSIWIATYLALNIAYSIYLKQSVVVDIIILSMMYTLRIFAGSAATSTPVSEWLLSFSTLFFFSLACVKRYTEIIRSKNKITIDGRGYRQVDASMVQTLGVGTGLTSILVVLLYLQSSDIRDLYSRPQNLWFATPILLFWISRIWILGNRDEVHDDPVIFAVKDKVSWLCLILLVITFGFAS